MKTQYLVIAVLLCFGAISRLKGQNYIAYDVPYGTPGNQALDGLVVGNDFRVVNPITISSLGVFSSGTNGIQGSTVLAVQVFERSGRSLGMLLETMTFDAANPGTRSGASFFKPLQKPLTLLPGNYTIAAYGFDTNNPEGNAGRPPYSTNNPPPWKVNDGGGLLCFEGVSRYGRSPGLYPGHLDKGPANRYAAGTFMYSSATLPSSSFAADYASLVAGVTSFPLDDVKHVGSVAVLDNGAFPVLVEHGGNRLVIEAAGTYNGDFNAARAVAFSHFQFENSPDPQRLKLFENAIQWTARKSDPSAITIGITPQLSLWFLTNVNYSYLVERGYHVIPIDCETLDLASGLPAMDVLVLDGHARGMDRIAGAVKQFTASGGGLVMSLTPRYAVYLNVQPAFLAANDILAPFSLCYRPSLASPADLSFTNVQSVPYPPEFNAFPAARMLYEDRLGTRQLNGQEKAIALNTINYAVNARPDLLPSLTSVYSSGTTAATGGTPVSGTISSFVDATVIAAAQGTNLLGQWLVDGNDLVAQNRRGSVDYNFNVSGADVYRLQIEGTQDLPIMTSSNFDLVLSLDGVRLGRFTLTAPYGVSGALDVFTPYLLSGAHTLRVFWDNAQSYTELRLQRVRVQTGLGADTDGDGIKDWVEQYIASQSGLNNTNSVINSYTSPFCIEGRDPYLSLMQLNLEGSDSKITQLRPLSAGAGRWFADVPLSAYANSQVILQASYQNGALMESRTLQWTPINVLDGSWNGGSITIRKGDRLLLNALPAGAADGGLRITVGTNVYTGKTFQPIACGFPTPGAYTVKGTYLSSSGTLQSGALTVFVVGHDFTTKPACWVGMERLWDIPTIAPGVVLQADNRLFMEQTATLGEGGQEYGMYIDQNEPRTILARMNSQNGPILDSTQARGFHLWGAGDTYLRIVERYPDGSQLVEMQLVMSPVLPDLTVELDTIVGGVMFEDGTVTKTLTAADFNARGQCPVRFIRPASARTSTCHSIKVYQGADLVGYLH